jgi:hypothetical protein
MISITNLENVALVTTNPVLAEDTLITQKKAIQNVMREIKSDLQAGSFDTNNSEWLECEYQNNAYGYTVRNFGTWEGFSFKDEDEDIVLCNDHAVHMDNLMRAFNERHPNIICS